MHFKRKYFYELYRTDFRNYYRSPEETSTNKMHVKIKSFGTQIKKKLVSSSYLSRFADIHYINRVKHPTF